MASTVKKTTYSKRKDPLQNTLYDEAIKKEIKLIDKFIQASPKISPIKRRCLHYYF
jgi:hypothetical protein